MINTVSCKEKKETKLVKIGASSAAGGRSAPSEQSAAGEPRFFVVS